MGPVSTPPSRRDPPATSSEATSSSATANASASARSQPSIASPSRLARTDLYDGDRARHEPSPSSKSTSKSNNATSSTPSRRKANMNNDKAEKRRSSRACLECRLAKTKCHVTDNQDVCDRCAKFSFECRFVRHHRGRKPVSKLANIDADDIDAVAGSSRLGGFGSDDDMASDHDSDSANEDVKHDADAPKGDDAPASAIPASERASAKDHDSNMHAAPDGSRKSREVAPMRTSSSRSHSKARLHRNPNNLHELDTSARRRIWEMLAQKIPQRGSTYTFVSKGEVAHDNLQTSSSKSVAKSTLSRRATSPSADDKEGSDKKHRDAKAEDQSRSQDPAVESSSTHPAKSSGPSQHFASTFRNLLRPVDKRAIATTAQEEAASAVTARYPRLPDPLNIFGPKDPVDSGILSMAAARRLYAYYFQHLNPWGMNFDPLLVSHDAVRASSSFLYSTILYLASRYIELADGEDDSTAGFYPGSYARPRPDDDRVTRAISAQLGSHVRSCAVSAFALGDRRMETGVAMYLSSVWKEADDHFTILYCSYAAKIMSDIPTELLSLLPSSTPTSSKNGAKTNDATTAANLQQQRLRRNQQRQFLFHFIQEHTHLLHFAPRPNFDRGPSLLRNLLAWADDALATEDDVLLCADIDSVLLQTKYKSIMERAQAQEKDTLYGGSECFLLLQSFMDELEGWRSRWELQARKIDQRFGRDAESSQDAEKTEAKEADDPDGFDVENLAKSAGHLALSARMHLLSIMRSSLVMQISSIAFRASLRDINKAKPSVNGSKSSSGASSAFSPSALSAMDDRAEQIYYTCLDSALALLNHTVQMPPSVLRHAQDMIMVLAPHAALLATYLISLPLPSVPPNFPATAAAESERLGYEYAKVKTRVRRRKEYERKCLELMGDTRESFRLAQVRSDDHVGLCAQYFDSLLNVIEGDAQDTGHTRPGRSLLGSSSVVAGTKRSRSSVGGEEDAVAAPRGVGQSAAVENAGARASSAGPTPSSRVAASASGQGSRHGVQHRHHPASTTNMDASAAETLLNLHSEAPAHPPGAAGYSGEGSAQDGEEGASANNENSSPTRVFSSTNPGGANSGYYSNSSHHLAHSRMSGAHSASTPPGSTSVAGGAGSFSPGSFISTGMFGHFGPPATGSIPGSPQHAGFHAHHAHQHHPGHHAHYPNPGMQHSSAEFGFAPGSVMPAGGGTVTPTGAAGTGGTSTPVDWTWLQSFLEVPEFSWM